MTSNVFCFSNQAADGEIFQAKVKFGIQRDRNLSVEEGMTLYEKNSVYFPGKEYYSSDPLPADWIGLITDKTVLETSSLTPRSNNNNKSFKSNNTSFDL